MDTDVSVSNSEAAGQVVDLYKRRRGAVARDFSKN